MRSDDPATSFEFGVHHPVPEITYLAHRLITLRADGPFSTLVPSGDVAEAGKLVSAKAAMPTHSQAFSFLPFMDRSSEGDPPPLRVPTPRGPDWDIEPHVAYTVKE